MIINKLLKSFYLIEIKGDATRIIMDSDFGLKSISIGSKTIPSDIEAGANLYKIMNLFKEIYDDLEESNDFNPDFFPGLKPLSLTREQEIESDIIRGHIDEDFDKDIKRDRIAILNLGHFDSSGDFIFQRWTLENEEMSVIGKAGINPTVYVEEKQEKILEPMSIIGSTFGDKHTVH